jgi:uncharacterized membrane protein
MGNIPLHPLVVHFPLVLAVSLPAVLVILWIVISRGKVRGGAWWAGVAVSAILVVSSIAALKTGEQDEERVEQVVPESFLERHEERANAFLWAAAGTLILTLATAVLRAGRARTALYAASMGAALVAAASAVAVGHSGGSLVYEHNAGAAHAAGPGNMGRAPSPQAVADERGNDDHDDHSQKRR